MNTFRRISDLDGDSEGELFFHHRRTGVVSVWFMKATVVERTAVIPNLAPPTEWRVGGLADFDQDGDADLIFQQRLTGILGVWLLTSTGGLQGTRVIQSPQVANPKHWLLAAATDVTGEGIPDFVWRNIQDGSVTAWQMNGTNFVKTLSLFGSANNISQWRLAAAGDFKLRINAEKELVIRDVSVVDNARASGRGPWSFGELIARIAPASMDPSVFAEEWLKQWLVESVNGYRVTPRSEAMRATLSRWPKRADGRVDLSKAPFRLLSVVKRTDLKTEEAPIGEGRFVFGALDEENSPLEFTVIFEFALPGTSRARWDIEFHRLSERPFGEGFNKALQILTDQFTLKDRTSGRVNGSPLSQVRTNEIEFDSPWELREFKLSPMTGRLVQVPVAQTPNKTFNTTDGPLVAWIRNPQTQDAILRGIHQVLPALLGGSALVDDTWLPEIGIPEEVRRGFALQTCDGCHSQETNTNFLHIENRAAGESASFSEFLERDIEDRARLAWSTIMGLRTRAAGSARGTRVH